MRPIQMVDLKTQYQKLKPEIDKAVIDVLGIRLLLMASRCSSLPMH